jgi:hypothetical protein
MPGMNSGMIGHSDVAYVIDGRGHTRTEFDFDPGPGTAGTESSFSVELSNAAPSSPGRVALSIDSLQGRGERGLEVGLRADRPGGGRLDPL